MLTIDECYNTLNKNGNKYTKEEAKLIRETLYQLAELVINQKTLDDEEVKRKKSNTLH